MNKIDIDVQTQFIPEQSRPERDLFVFAYTVTIANHGQIPTQLLRRHWVIKDFNQKVMEVQGDGVIGEQPRLMPGESFTYTSGTTLETDVGTTDSFSVDAPGRDRQVIQSQQLANNFESATSGADALVRGIHKWPMLRPLQCRWLRRLTCDSQGRIVVWRFFIVCSSARASRSFAFEASASAWHTLACGRGINSPDGRGDARGWSALHGAAMQLHPSPSRD